jgi:hypothetical protein
MRTAAKIEIPTRPHNVFDPRGQPVALFPVEPEIKDPDRDVSALRPDRQHRILQQWKVLAIRAAGDQQPHAAHRDCCRPEPSFPGKRGTVRERDPVVNIACDTRMYRLGRACP